MKRKIAAIFAADVVGYSRMTAADEEGTLQRLASCREVIDDFIAKASGRIFNTAGDSVFAEFSSSVGAVCCAIDIQEALRSRNLAWPPERQMLLRIGITVGDIVERDGDLLGDAVNIAGRLEALAEPGGICVSRGVHEQVANKVAVQFFDIGEQQVKNIPHPVHAYSIGVTSGPKPVGAPPTAKPAGVKNSIGSRWLSSVAAGVALLAAIAVAYLLGGRGQPAATQIVSAEPAPPLPAPRTARNLVPETIPFVADRFREEIRRDYLPAAGPKALAIGALTIGFVTAQSDEATANAAALRICQSRADAIRPSPRRCELYAIGNDLVPAAPAPPLPAPPWIVRDELIETPFAVDDVPLLTENAKSSLERNFAEAKKPKALAVQSSARYAYYYAQQSQDEAARRALELCGDRAGVPCLIVAIDDVFVVPLPKTMTPTGLLQPHTIPSVLETLREETVRKIRNAPGGWSALAVGVGGRPGVALRAADEPSALKEALSDCGRQDRDAGLSRSGRSSCGRMRPPASGDR